MEVIAKNESVSFSVLPIVSSRTNARLLSLSLSFPSLFQTIIMLPTVDPTTLQVTTTLDRKILTEPDLDNWKLTTTYQWIQQYLVELIEGTQKQPQEETEREPNQVSVTYN